ncbi:hypothetical protein FDUTEX481_06656 [Tolypothrix sp. PCC 7601]|nr:hypothetical protein FDUTEX481_06656 [Tolypothrix sp. PCC 7601]
MFVKGQKSKVKSNLSPYPQSLVPITPNPHSLRSWGPRVPQSPVLLRLPVLVTMYF